MTAPHATSAVGELIELAEVADPNAAADLVLRLLDQGVPAADLVEHALGAVQVEVGRRWEANEWTVADEHAATAVVDVALSALEIALGPPSGERGSAVVVCAEGEWHATPARMAAVVLRDAGWDARFLGGSTPASELGRHLGAHHADVVALSCTTVRSLVPAAECVRASQRARVPVVLGGAAATHRAAETLGADGWVATIRELAVPASVRPPAAPSPGEVRASRLAVARHLVVEGALDRIGDRTDFVRDVVGQLVDANAASLLLGDDDLVARELAWADAVLRARGGRTDATRIQDAIVDAAGELAVPAAPRRAT